LNIFAVLILPPQPLCIFTVYTLRRKLSTSEGARGTPSLFKHLGGEDVENVSKLDGFVLRVTF
jgi:hypothetical protein